MISISILGATGSIGTSTLDIVRMHPDRFRVVALTAKRSVEKLAGQIAEFAPALAAVVDEPAAQALSALLPAGQPVEVCCGSDGYRRAAVMPEADVVVAAMVGAAGLGPTLHAIDAGKDIALANKETLVMAGEIVMARAAERRVRLVPVDSEHSAIYQCLLGNRRQDLVKILLTGSGGPFRCTAVDQFDGITVSDALAHPNWTMGRKISIDSATLMNKGLEVIEAMHLFSVPLEQIEVVIHPQSIVHSMVSFADGSVMAQMGRPDMKSAIAFALSGPERLNLGIAPPDFPLLGALAFEPPDLDRFPCLGLAFDAAAAGGSMPTVLNAANEIAVSAFLEQRLPYTAIADVIRRVMDAHHHLSAPSLDQILAGDREARQAARTLIDGMTY